MASLNPFHYIKAGYDKIAHPDGSPTVPGVGGPAKNPAALVHDPQTGLFYDPTTGTSYTDPNGTQVVKDPNVAQQVAQNFNASRGFMNQLGKDSGMVDQAFQGQTSLAGSLNNTINDPNATSVAGTQLVAGQNDLARTQLAQASGVGGPNAAAARRQASINIGQSGADLNQQQALLRATEVNNAQGRLGQVLGQQADEGQSAYNTNAGAAGNFATIAAHGGAGNQDAALGLAKDKDKEWSGVLNGAVGGGTKML